MAISVLSVISYILATVLVSCFGCFVCFVAYLHHLHKITEHIPGPPRSSFILGHIPDISKYKAATGRTMVEFLLEKVSFNINTHAIERPDSPFPDAIRTYLRGMQDNFDNPLNATLLAIFQFKLLQNATKKEQINAVRFLRKFARDCIADRMKNIADDKTVPDDYLSLLIKHGADSSLSMDDIIDEFLTIFVAGQETTANSLSFVLYEILSNPHVEAKLLNEVNEVLGERGYVEFDDLAKLKYLGQVLD